jgi:hypothetical protein
VPGNGACGCRVNHYCADKKRALGAFFYAMEVSEDADEQSFSERWAFKLQGYFLNPFSPRSPARAQDVIHTNARSFS